jgi:uncharacterized protein YciW
MDTCSPTSRLKTLFKGSKMLNQSPSDTLDRLVGLLPQSQTYAARREREKVVFATQGSEDGLFDPALPGLSVEERLYVALYACLLTPSPDLAAEYESRLQKLGANLQTILLIQKSDIQSIQSIQNARLEAILNFTHTLITKPISADKMALSALPKAGLSTPEVVTLAQLISFVSYQVRLAAGLRAMKALEMSS